MAIGARVLPRRRKAQDEVVAILRRTPARATGVADRTWTIPQLVDAALALAPALPTETPPDRRRKFVVIDGGKR